MLPACQLTTLLLQSNADPNLCEPLLYALGIAADEDCDTEQADLARLGVLKELVAAKADVNKVSREDVVPLVQAVAVDGELISERHRAARLDAVNTLLAAKGTVDQRQRACGETALIVAAGRGFTEAVSVLCEVGADPLLQDHEGEDAITAAYISGFTIPILEASDPHGPERQALEDAVRDRDGDSVAAMREQLPLQAQWLYVVHYRLLS